MSAGAEAGPGTREATGSTGSTGSTEPLQGTGPSWAERFRGRVRLSPELRERLEVDRLRRRPAVPDHRHPLRQQVRAYPSLLDQVLGSSLEPDYETVAHRRAHEAAVRAAATPAAPAASVRPGEPGAAAAAAGAPPPSDDDPTPATPRRTRSRSARAGTVLAVVVFALLVASAVRETRADAPTDALVRETLLAEVEQRRADLAEVQREVAEARRANGELSSALSATRAQRSQAVGSLRQLAATSGFQAVSGPGLRWTVGNGPTELVTANDLALLVNGLWQAGAEAVAVNGQRLTARSAITQSGAGINVNSTPLTAPFVVSVIGDQRTLESLFSETRTGYLWLLTVDTFGFSSAVEQVDELQLPAARRQLLTTCDACAADDRRSGQVEED